MVKDVGKGRNDDSSKEINKKNKAQKKISRKLWYSKFTKAGDSDQSEFVNQESVRRLKKMRKRYNLPDREVSEDNIASLSSKRKKELYKIKHGIKDLEPFLQTYLSMLSQKQKDFFTMRLVDPQRFKKHVVEALKDRKEASSFLKSGIIDCKPAEILEKLKKTHDLLKDYLERFKKPEVDIKEITNGTNEALESLVSKKQDFEIYWKIMSNEDKEVSLKNLALAEEASNKYWTNSFSEENSVVEKADVLIKLRETNGNLSKIIEEQKTPEKIQKGLDDQVLLADQFLSKAQSVHQTLQISMSITSIETAKELIKTSKLEKVDQGNLPDAIEVFRTLVLANETFESRVQQLPESSSNIQIQGDKQEEEDKDTINALGDEKQKETTKQPIKSEFEGVKQSFESIQKTFDLEIAKKGFERFKYAYNAENDKWQEFLINEEYGGLQAVFLGLKPCMLTIKEEVCFFDKYDEYMKETLKKNSRGDIDAIETNPGLSVD